MVVGANQSLVHAIPNPSQVKNKVERGMVQSYFSCFMGELCMLGYVGMNEIHEGMMLKCSRVGVFGRVYVELCWSDELIVFNMFVCCCNV